MTKELQGLLNDVFDEDNRALRISGDFVTIPDPVPEYVQTYSTADRTLSAYTADAESGAYTGDGGGVATVSSAAAVAKLSDLNALRVAYENLRAFTEDLAQLVTAMVDDLQASGQFQ